MRRMALTLLLPALAVGGCTAGQPTAPPSAGTRPATTAAPPSASPSPTVEKPVLPAGFPTLVPVLHGSANAQLPPFTPTGKGYTLFVTCEGEGARITVRYNDERDADVWPCDGVVTRQRVYGKRQPQHLRIEIRGGGRWGAGVVDGIA